MGRDAVSFRMLVALGIGLMSCNPHAFAMESIEYHALQGTDTVGNHPLTFNIAGLNAKSGGFVFAEHVRNREIGFKLDTRGTPVASKTDAEETIRGVEFMTSGGGGLIFGAGLNHSSLEYSTTSEVNQFFDRVPLTETLRRTEGRAKFGIELTDDFRFGAIARYRYIYADVLGSFNLPLNERTRYSGGLFGAGAGAQFNAKTASLALQYLSPVEGKVSIQGEDKVTSEPGAISVSGHFKPFSNTAIGGSYLSALHGKDELRANTTGPNPENPQSISPKGVQPERNVYRTNTAALGVAFGVGRSLEFKTTFFLGCYVYLRNAGSNLDEPKDNPFQGHRARMSLAYDKGSVFVELGADGALREKTLDPQNNGQVDSIASKEYNFFGTLGLGF